MNLIANRNQGLDVTLASWLKKSGPFRDLFWDFVRKYYGLFNRNAVQCLLKGQDRDFFNGEGLFGFLIFEVWRKQYRVSL